MPATIEGFGYRAAQEESAKAGGKHHEREGYREEEQGGERCDREAYEQVVVEGAPGDPQDRLYHDGYHHRLDAVKQTRDRRHIRVGYGQVREQPQNEDGGDHEEGAGHDAPQRPVQPPPDVGRDLLRLRTGQEHAEVERPQVLLLGNPPLLLDELAVHDRDLTCGTPEVDEAELYPEPESLPEAHGLGLHGTVLRNGLGIHSISTTLVNKATDVG